MMLMLLFPFTTVIGFRKPDNSINIVSWAAQAIQENHHVDRILPMAIISYHTEEEKLGILFDVVSVLDDENAIKVLLWTQLYFPKSDVYVLLANLLSNCNQLSEACGVLKEGMEETPYNASIYFSLESVRKT